MKKLLLTAVCLIVLGSVSAQKFPKNAVDFLKGESKINLVFDFEGLTIDGTSEESYIEERMADEKTPEKAQEWKDNWEGAHRTKFKNTFTKACNDELKNVLVNQSYTDATYTITVKILDVDPGNFGGPFSNPAKLRAVFYIVKTADKDTVLAELRLNKVYRNTALALNPVEYMRIDEGFGALGDQFGSALQKALK